MPRTPVSSSSLVSVGYSASMQILEVEFVNGSIYLYSRVPQRVYDGFMAAASHGSYFAAHVRNAGYAYERVC